MWPASRLDAQYSKDPVTDYLMRQNLGIPSIGDHVGSLVQNTGEFAALKGQLHAQIVAARANFWRLYPEKPGFAAAREELAHRLRDKDNYYLFIRSGPLNHPGFAQLTGGEVDGGITKLAEPAFQMWEQAVRQNFGYGKDFLRLLQMIGNRELAKEAVAKADPFYRAYVARRDWEEFRAHGLAPPDLPPRTWRLAQMAIGMGKPDPYGAALIAAEKSSQFEARCASDVPLALGVARIPAKACACLQRTLQHASPLSQWQLETAFTPEAFLIASVSRIGLRQKVAACLR
jgi:hypothetical protein